MVLSHHVTDLLSHIALRLLKIIEPYLVEQERMANAQLLMYGSKHLEQNFFLLFFFLKKCEYGRTAVPHSTQQSHVVVKNFKKKRKEEVLLQMLRPIHQKLRIRHALLFH